MERLLDHLATCRRCGRWLLDLQELRYLEGEPALDAAAVAADWRRLLAHLPGPPQPSLGDGVSTGVAGNTLRKKSLTLQDDEDDAPHRH